MFLNRVRSSMVPFFSATVCFQNSVAISFRVFMFFWGRGGRVFCVCVFFCFYFALLFFLEMGVEMASNRPKHKFNFPIKLITSS